MVTKKPAGAGFSYPQRILSLAELRSTSRFTQSYFLSLYFARIPGHKSFGTECGAERLIVVHQSARQTVANGSRLTKATAALHSHLRVKLFNQLG
jgi:hypothetical protein